MTCDRPDVQDALLLARARGDRIANEHGDHLARCEACRRALELSERVSEHCDDELSSVEILQLQMRVMPQLSPRSEPSADRRRRTAYAAALVAVAAAGSAAAGTYYAVHNAPEPAPRPIAARPSGQVTPARRAHVPSSAAELPQPIAPALPPPQAARTGAPVARSEPPAAPASPSARALWAEAADALRRGDRARAERALGQLTSTRDDVTRDSAELALIELWMKSGQDDRCRASLGRLAASAATPALRSRALALSRELDDARR
jgi:hypothetical protein